jgi:hypothetical protein
MSWQRTFVAFAAIATLALMAAVDRLQHPHEPRKLKEYGFLVYAMLVSVAYGVAHDHVTATLSPEYFLVWKGLADDPRPFRWAVTVLAVRASFWTGLVGGAVLLVANNPARTGRPAQLPYAELVRLSWLPPIAAALGAVAFGGSNAIAGVGAPTARQLVAPEQVRAFVTVWAVHAGSYAGAAIGVLASGVLVAMRRAGARRAAAHER